MKNKIKNQVRSSVSADISEHVIWVNSTDFESTVRAVKIHESLIEEFGYTDGSILEESSLGKGVSITVCDNCTTVRQMREDYAYVKKQERGVPTTEKHRASAKELLIQLYGQDEFNQ